jgi:hypothetical protein
MHKKSICDTMAEDHAKAQVINHWLSTVVDRVALQWVFPEYFGLHCQFSFHQLLHIN